MTAFRAAAHAALWSLAVPAAAATDTADAPLVIVNASLVDGTGAPARRTSIHIRDGRILSFGNPAPPETRVLDARGATVLPGLIDSHVHFQAVPGAVFRQDSAETRRTLMYRHLRGHLANGVTTVLDAAIASSVLREIQTYLASGGVGPRVMALGPTFHNPGGYMDGAALSEYWAPRWRASATPEDVDALYREYDGIANLVGVKVAATHGFGGPLDTLETHTPEMLDVIGRRARDHERQIYVHVNDHRGVEIALGLGAHALTHLVLDDAQAGQVARMRETGMHVMTTIAIVDGFADRHRPGVANAPRVRLTVPEVERETARDPAAWDRWGTTFMRIVAPWLPEWFARWYADWQLSEAWVASVVRGLQDALMRYHEAGVPIVMGTDSGGWPHMVHALHGPTALRELELMADAGMTPAEVLRAATVAPARMMGILDQVGTVEVGKRADLIVVRGDPLQDISVLANLEWVIKDGEARRPGEWMSD